MTRPDTPTPSHWAEVQRLFHDALALPVAERAAWLAAAAADPRVRAEVGSLVAADGRPDRLLDGSPADLLGAPAARGAAPFAEGRVVGAYEIVRSLGEGGMGVVYLARDGRTGDPVALKVLRLAVSEALPQAEARLRFLREIDVGTSLAHPGLVPVLDAGETDGRLWLAMPYVEGETLRARSKREGRLPSDVVACVGRQLAVALAWLAARDIVHRDVKPDNVLLAPADRVGVRAVLADFGVARALDAADVGGRLTATGMIIGTVRYMSPEQIRGERVGPGADVFALGGVLYEALTGEPPYRGAAHRALLGRGPGGAPPEAPDVRRMRPDVPEAIAGAIRAALAPDAGDRSTADELARALGDDEARPATARRATHT